MRFYLELVCLLVPLGQIYKIMQTIYESVLTPIYLPLSSLPELDGWPESIHLNSGAENLTDWVHNAYKQPVSLLD